MRVENMLTRTFHVHDMRIGPNRRAARNLPAAARIGVIVAAAKYIRSIPYQPTIHVISGQVLQRRPHFRDVHLLNGNEALEVIKAF
jgi:hypothetical protein